MRKSIGGKVYDTDKMTTLASRSVHNGNGNYTGETELAKTRGGNYAIVITSNGQDGYRQNDIIAVDKSDVASEIDSWELTEVEAAALVAEGILKEA